MAIDRRTAPVGVIEADHEGRREDEQDERGEHQVVARCDAGSRRAAGQREARARQRAGRGTVGPVPARSRRPDERKARASTVAATATHSAGGARSLGAHDAVYSSRYGLSGARPHRGDRSGDAERDEEGDVQADLGRMNSTHQNTR